MLPWYVSVSLVAGVLLASSYGERLGEEERREPDSFAVGFKKLGMNDRSREGKNFPSFQFTFDVGCQEGVRTKGLDLTTLDPFARDHLLKYTTLTYTTRVLGLDYAGRANMTSDGQDCLSWADYYDDYFNVGEHNYCRNPGGKEWSMGVWCIVSLNPPSLGYCPVPRCPQTQPILNIPADEEGYKPRASSKAWPAAEMPSSWTICSAFMLNDWPSPDKSKLSVWSLCDWYPLTWGELQSYCSGELSISATESGTIYTAIFPRDLYSIKANSSKPVFPGTWLRSCFSFHQMENYTIQLRLVVNGSLVGEEHFEEDRYMAPEYYRLNVGQVEWYESRYPNLFRGMATDVNMFSSALSMERMVDMTNGQGSENCWVEGDFVSWSNSSWTLEDNATMLQLDKHIHSSCRKESSVNIFVMDRLHRQEDCMRHCQKLGDGRSPPVTTHQQWLSMQSEIEAIVLEDIAFRNSDIVRWLWLSVTEGDQGEGLARLSHWPTTELIEGQGEVPLVAEEGVWRDYYTGKRAEFLSGEP